MKNITGLTIFVRDGKVIWCDVDGVVIDDILVIHQDDEGQDLDTYNIGKNRVTQN